MPKIATVFLALTAVLPVALPVKAAVSSGASDSAIMKSEQTIAMRPRCRSVSRNVCRTGRGGRQVCRAVTKRVCR